MAEAGDHVTIQLSEAELANLARIMRWNTMWTAAGGIAGWIALAFVVVAVL